MSSRMFLASSSFGRDYEAEKFKVDGKHYSHPHPLSPCEVKEDDDYEDADQCSICGLPILSILSYNCTVTGCKFFLHNECALKVPPKLIHPTHGPELHMNHTLYIVKRSSSSTFTYKCEDCDFETHPLVALGLVGNGGVRIEVNHKSHPRHPLVAICKEISCECDACGKTQQGFFFSCQECNFWVHKGCTILPNAIMFVNHPQPFILAYNIPPYQIEEGCVVCKKPLLVRHNGVYFCPQSRTFAHITCASDKSDGAGAAAVAVAASKTRLELIQLPDEEWESFPSLVIRRYAGTNPLGPQAYYESYKNKEDDLGVDKLTVEKYHKQHPLNMILTNDYDAGAAVVACDLCVQPIDVNSSFYTCRNEHCHFVAHKICADILPILNFFIPNRSSDTVPVAIFDPDLGSSFFCSIFHCRFCHRPCNGLCYYVTGIAWFGESFFIDLECMAAPTTLNHASHAQHILFRTHGLSALQPLTCCSKDSLLYDVYRCILCEYFIHVTCAMLPKKIISYECHHHPLYLLFSAATSPPTFCEVCEKDIDLKYWLYYCGECDQYFHVNCIPSVGYLSKVKFGGIVSIPAECHIHPDLILTRMLTEPTQRCGHCKEIIQGLVDEIALFCSLCHFWLHFSCARDLLQASSDGEPLRLYSDADDNELMRKIKIELDIE